MSAVQVKPSFRRTIDRGEEVVRLEGEELEIIKRIQTNDFADVKYDPYEPYVDFFTGKVMPVPLSSAPEPKRRFLPSKWEAIKVAKIVRAIKKGWIKLRDELTPEEDMERRGRVYDIWSGEVDASILAIKARHISAPKMALPHHRESYNPPEEYLLTPGELEEWMATPEEDRPHNFVPQNYRSLRLVPGYERFIHERYGRCLDLFLCPRAITNKITMHPDDLLPSLPDPRDLRPFPTQKSIEYIGHEHGISSISVDPSGQWLLSADLAGRVRLWEVQTGHCRHTWDFSIGLYSETGQDTRIRTVAWNPNKALFMFAMAIGKFLLLVVPPEMPQTESTFATVQQMQSQLNNVAEDVTSNKTILKWKIIDENSDGVVFSIEHWAPIHDLHWHRRGDYFSAICPEAETGAHQLTIHQLARRISQNPLKKMPGILRSVRFHPTLPHLVLATQKSVRIYDLLKHEQVKKLLSGVQSISSLAIHPAGDNVIVGSHDQRLVWFDLDFSSRAYHSLSNHQAAIRSVAFHPAFPLLASAGDDGALQIIHGQVFSDLSSNPMIVPVKTIREFDAGSAVTQVTFHPTQPWVFASTSKGQLTLFV